MLGTWLIIVGLILLIGGIWTNRTGKLEDSPVIIMWLEMIAIRLLAPVLITLGAVIEVLNYLS